jgi:hypothetical protein
MKHCTTSLAGPGRAADDVVMSNKPSVSQKQAIARIRADYLKQVESLIRAAS